MDTCAVAVRSLCDLAAKSGDLDTRFTPSTTAFEGLAGHRVVAGRRSAQFEREVRLTGECGGLTVRGRADGFDSTEGRLEEVKTYRGDLARMPGNRRALHWAQLKAYGALLCRQRKLGEVELALVYFNVADSSETVLKERVAAALLWDTLERYCLRYLAWALQERERRQARDIALDALKFPYPHMHAAQRLLARRVYASIKRGVSTLAQAPTGVGKTLGTLFPALKAQGAFGLDKIFFLTAKRSGRAVALATLAPLVAHTSGVLRVLELTAKESACVNPGRQCNADSCPLARGFYDRLPAARAAAAAGTGLWDGDTVRSVAAKHAVCPYYLAQELARWTDVVVADYNYYFDARALLHALTAEAEWRITVLVDEAHNLLPRAREMYSGALKPEDFAAAQALAPRPVRALLSRVCRAWPHIENASAYQPLEELPTPMMEALGRLTSGVRDHYADAPDTMPAPLQLCFFDALKLQQLAEAFGGHSLLDLDGNGTLTLRNLVPASFLAARFASSRATILFSATLSPDHYYRELLGLSKDSSWLDIGSPFHADQLTVHIARRVSTRYRHRRGSAASLIALMGAQLRARPGNYLAYFSSFEYLHEVAAGFEQAHPNINVWRQHARMSEQQRAAFLDHFAQPGQGLGFAVLGGAFAEGIDLPGERLIGVFIATLGMPQVNPVNEQLKLRMQDLFGRGFDYAYLYPGLQKVVQAAGRVIRTTEDSGTVHLMDERFENPEIRRLLPAWWRIEVA